MSSVESLWSAKAVTHKSEAWLFPLTHKFETLPQSHENVVLLFHLPPRHKEIRWASNFSKLQVLLGSSWIFFSTERHSEDQYTKQSKDNMSQFGVAAQFAPGLLLMQVDFDEE